MAQTDVRIPFSLASAGSGAGAVHSIRRPACLSRQEDRRKRCEEIFTIQAMGLKKRLEQSRLDKSAVIGILRAAWIPRWRCLSPPAPFPCWRLSPSLITAVSNT